MLYRWLFEQPAVDELAPDLDSTVMARYGQHTGATHGYIPTKPGCASCQPLRRFVSDWQSDGARLEDPMLQAARQGGPYHDAARTLGPFGSLSIAGPVHTRVIANGKSEIIPTCQGQTN